MIEEYGTLSEEELLEEIRQELEATDLDLSTIELSFEAGKLFVEGNLINEEEVETLAEVLENYLDPEDYELDVDLLDSAENFDEEFVGANSPKDDEEEEDLSEKGFSEIEDESELEEEDEVDDEEEDEENQW